MQSTRYSCQILIKLEFYRPIFEKFADIEFHENLSRGSEAVPCVRIETHYEANSQTLTLLNHTSVSYNMAGTQFLSMPHVTLYISLVTLCNAIIRKLSIFTKWCITYAFLVVFKHFSLKPLTSGLPQPRHGSQQINLQ